MLELENKFRQLPRMFESYCDKLTDGLTKATENVWNEIVPLKVGLLGQVAQYKKEKLTECPQMLTRVVKFLQSPSIQPIPLTNDIWLDTQRRLIGGRMPNTKKTADRDAAIIASLVSFFRQAEDDQDTTLLFCSENDSDFALDCGSGTRDRVFALDPMIQDDLPPARYFLNLETMLAFANGYEALPEPTDELIQQAVAMRDQHDWDSDEYYSLQKLVDQRFEKWVANHYTTDIAPSLPFEISRVRAEIKNAIHKLLDQCRACSTWDERSEDKLGQWTEFVPEALIPYTSLPNMVRIKRNLEKYLQIHREEL